MQYGLSEKQLKEIIDKISGFPEIEEAVLFGSRAIDTYKEASDIDIAIKGKKVKAALAAKLKFLFEEDTYLPFFFDFVAYPTITNAKLREHINKKGVVIYRKKMSEHDLDDYRINTIKINENAVHENSIPDISQSGKSCSDKGGSEWKECILGDLIANNQAELQTGPFGTMLNASEYTVEGTPVIAVQDIGNNKLHTKKLNFIGPSAEKRLERYKVKADDIIFGRKGAVDRRALVTAKEEGWIQGSDCIRLRFDETINSQFVSYQLGSNRIKEWLNQHAHGATMPSLNQEILSLLPFVFPPLPEQHAIASVLSSLDDKIDLLNRQNKTLEAMAETLFRQWFVEEAEEGWKTVRIGDYARTNISSIDKNTKLGTIRYLDTGSLTEGKIADYQIFDITEAPSRARRIVKHNDILISTVRPDQKHYGILKDPAEDLIVSTGFCVITCERINPYFIYCLLTTDEMTKFLHSIAEGSTSTYPSLKPSDIENLEFQLPPERKIDIFSMYAESAWNRIDYNYRQIHSLEKLRDTLLPKLMSGEVRVKV